MIFDPTMSKKKKKKKKPFMLDEEGDAQTEETQPSETKEVEPEPTEDKDVEADEEDSRKKGEWLTWVTVVLGNLVLFHQYFTFCAYSDLSAWESCSSKVEAVNSLHQILPYFW